MDGFDGTIARLTRTESNFGVQLDSLVDAVTFGLVASMLAFKWGFQAGYAQAGSIISFVFLSAGLIRLARFNVFKEAQVIPANIFIACPSPPGRWPSAPSCCCSRTSTRRPAGASRSSRSSCSWCRC